MKDKDSFCEGNEAHSSGSELSDDWDTPSGSKSQVQVFSLGGVSTKQLDRKALEDKQKKWMQHNSKKYSQTRKFGYSQGEKAMLPPEVLRKVIKDHGDMSSKRFR